MTRALVGGLVIATATAFPVAPTRAGDLDAAIGIVLRMNQAAAQSQKKVEKLDDQASDLRSEYRATQQQLMSLRQYNEQVARLVAAQEEAKAQLEEQVGEATQIGRGVTPLMIRMVEALKRFVALDMPFLLEERRSRVEQLEALLDRPDVTEAERYRLIMEAYQVENEYGRTIEAYRGKLEGEGGSEERTVEFLRVGRVALVYRTIDGSEIGYWDKEANRWSPLPARYQSSVKEGFRIAKKQAAPDLFSIPVPAPEEDAK